MVIINQDEDVESVAIKKDNKQKSDVFGLWVKLKIPKEEEGMDIGEEKIGFENKEDEMNKISSNMKRVCHVCRKAFSSGKALGGHMRIHVQLANKKDLVFKEKLNKVHKTITLKQQISREEAKENVIDFAKRKHRYKKTAMAATTDCYGGSGNMIKKPTCIICGKDFPSMKSLFGHMRCHPERDWRGIHPPSSMPKNTSPSSSSSLSDADNDQMGILASAEKNRAVDLTESLMGWPVTAKRGRKAMAVGSSSELSSSEDDQLREAVNYLMMLAQGGSLESGVTKSQDFGESEAANSFCKAKILEINLVSKSKRRMTDQSSVGIRNRSAHGNERRGSNEVGKAVIVHGESVNKLEDDDERDYSSDDDQMDSKSRGKLNDEEFECSYSKSNKKKRKKMKLCDLKLSKSVSPVDHKVGEVTSITQPHDKYRCNTCDKSFPTHQALGGHRSSHNKFNIILHNSAGETKQDSKRSMILTSNFSTSPALEGHKMRSNESEARSRQAPSSSENSHMCGKVMMDFDLNEVPPSEDEAGFGTELALGNYDHAFVSIE